MTSGSGDRRRGGLRDNGLNVGAWLAIGAGAGAALGSAMGNMPVWLAIGIAVGVIIGTVQSRKKG